MEGPREQFQTNLRTGFYNSSRTSRCNIVLPRMKEPLCFGGLFLISLFVLQVSDALGYLFEALPEWGKIARTDFLVSGRSNASSCGPRGLGQQANLKMVQASSASYCTGCGFGALWHCHLAPIFITIDIVYRLHDTKPNLFDQDCPGAEQVFLCPPPSKTS